MTDLDKLIAAVEADTLAPGMARRAVGEKSADVVAAHFGDLSAALRLHEALLPGWLWMVTAGEQMASVYENKERGLFFKADSDNPARAWLLAILRALKAQTPA